jgi:hypothetical protein
MVGVHLLLEVLLKLKFIFKQKYVISLLIKKTAFQLYSYWYWHLHDFHRLYTATYLGESNFFCLKLETH